MKILCVRNFANTPNLDTYNLQEIGLAQALANKGISVDIVYFTKGNERGISYYETPNAKVKIFYMKAWRILSNAIYLKILKKDFLNNYDFIISTEYNQIMTYLLCVKCPNKVILYHGPYKTYHKILEFIYDRLFLKTIVKNVKLVIAKSTFAKEFLEKKGFKDVKVVGVGLDIKKFEEGKKGTTENDLIKKIKGRTSLLWIGRFDKEKNFMFLLNILSKLKEKENNKKFCMIIVGDGEVKNKKMFFEYAQKLGIINDIVYYPSVRQDEIVSFYKSADVFVFPSYYEIFGMVLLESMYFGLPVISSRNGGAIELIKNGYNGFIVNDFDVNKWVEIIIRLVNDHQLKKKIGANAMETIQKHFVWDVLVEKFILNLY